MKKLSTHWLTAVSITTLSLVSAMTWAAEQGPPPFVTYPILTHIPEQGLDHGHFIGGPGESAVPGPLTPHYGTAAFNAAETSLAASISAGLNFNVSITPDSYEGETAAASTTGVGALMVSGSNHIYPGLCDSEVCFPYAYATNNGTGWSQTVLPRVWNGTNFGVGFDPAIDFDKTGTFYYSYGVAPLSGSYPNAIVVVKSTDGVSWTQLTPVTFNTSKNFDDKYYIAVDRSNKSFANRIYVSWDRNASNNQTLYIAYSSNGGATWSAPIKVNDGSRLQRVIGAYPAVDQATGVVYDSWHDYAKNKIFIDKSSNGGATWGKDVAAANTHAGFGTDIGCVGGRSQGPAHSLAVGPSGTLYLVYADPVSGHGFDVLLTKSTNGGVTWSMPVTLNDDTGSSHQFHPTLTVTSNGIGGDKVTVSFYDRRDDTNNCLSDVYATQSIDSGTSWAPNIRVTAVQSNFDGNPNGPGDYSGAATFNASAYPFFSDHRNPDFEVYSAPIN